MITRVLIGWGVLVVASAVAPVSTSAQGRDWDPTQVYASRASLDSLRQRLTAAASSPAYSAGIRDRARRQATEIAERLDRGDFQVGDRVLVQVENEPTLSDTFTVAEGPAIVVPPIGPLALGGVLRAELEVHLTREIGRYVRDPVVRARSFARISIIGEVGRPGFYALPTDLLLTDALEQAGQPTRDADVQNITIERNNRTVWDAAALGEEIVQGRTLDQLNVRAGDRIVVGRRPRALGSMEGSMRTVLMIITIPAAIAGIVTLFR